ncbi:MAG: acylglycerol kinase family protein, partial [Gammaproteobacteria bacterium]|nr:acylglycerol kinase family protein [Gammaproteobacteria bacterium]
MPTASVSLFINPTAGRGRTARRLVRIRECLEDVGLVLTMHESRGVGDLEQQVFRAVSAGTQRVIVAGGDGSIHEAVNGIMRAGQRAALGIVPTGTGNDFAKASAVPLDWEHATQLLADRLAGNAPCR